DIAENVAENAVDITEAALRPASTHAAVYAGVAKTVIARPPLLVLAHIMRLTHLLEPAFGFGIIRIAVRMRLARLAPIGLADLVVGGVARDVEDVVIISGHGYSA